MTASKIDAYLQMLEFEFLLDRVVLVWTRHASEDCSGDSGDFCVNSDNYGECELQIGVSNHGIVTTALIEETAGVLDNVRGVWCVGLYDWSGRQSGTPFRTIRANNGGVQISGQY